MRNTEREQRIAEALACDECREAGKSWHKTWPELSARQWTITLHHHRATHVSESVRLAGSIDELHSWAEDQGVEDVDLDEMGRFFNGNDARNGLYGLVTELNDTIAGLERLEEVAEARLAVLNGEGAAVVNGGPVVTPQPRRWGHLYAVKDE